MKRKILAIVLAFIAGFIVVGVVESISTVLHPMPEGLDYKDADAMREYVKSLPASAFVLVLLSHGLGAFTAGLVCSLIAKEKWVPGALGLGVFFLLAGSVNLILIPHPGWFMVADVIVYLPAAYFGAVASQSLLSSKEQPAASTDDPEA